MLVENNQSPIIVPVLCRLVMAGFKVVGSQKTSILHCDETIKYTLLRTTMQFTLDNTISTQNLSHDTSSASRLDTQPSWHPAILMFCFSHIRVLLQCSSCPTPVFFLSLTSLFQPSFYRSPVIFPLSLIETVLPLSPPASFFWHLFACLGLSSCFFTSCLSHCTDGVHITG